MSSFDKLQQTSVVLLYDRKSVADPSLSLQTVEHYRANMGELIVPEWKAKSEILISLPNGLILDDGVSSSQRLCVKGLADAVAYDYPLIG